MSKKSSLLVRSQGQKPRGLFALTWILNFNYSTSCQSVERVLDKIKNIGTSVVLELARRFAGTPVANSAWFVAFDGEEDGLHGSKAFVKAAGSEFLSNLKAMLNFDMVGVNDKLFVGGTEKLTAVAQKLDPKISTMRDSGRSDHRSFATAGVPAIFFYRGDDPNYHSPKDKQADPKLVEAMISVVQSFVREAQISS